MHHSLEHLLTIQTFVLWIKGECSPREKEYWDAWLNKHSTHKELFRQAREIVEAVHSQHEIPNLQVELQKLSREINRYKRPQPGFSPSYSRRPAWWQKTGTIVAGLILFLALLGGIFAFQYGSVKRNNSERTATNQKEFNKAYTTDYGEKVTFRLSDGSNITLNANSSLRFSSTLNNGGDTQVFLQGEAYFDIAHLEGDQRRTFTVHTSDGAIHVLGTRFAVNTFGGGTQTVLEQGKITIGIKEHNHTGDLSSTDYVLRPGEMGHFTTGDNKITVKEVDTRLYTAWVNDKLTFAQAPIQEVARRIERTFGVEVIVDQKYRHQRVTGSIRSDNLDVLTQALGKILHTEVHKKDQTLRIGQTDSLN